MASEETVNSSVEPQSSPDEDNIHSSSSEKLELPGQLIFAILAAAVGSAFQHGYNTGIVNAPQTVIEKFISDTYYEKYKEIPANSVVTVIFSVMVSIFCLGGMVGALGTAYLAKAFGRKGGLILNNILVFISAALMGFGKTAKSYEMMIVGRFIIGVNAGLNAGLAPMYLTEISPVHLRGAIGTIYQLNITISILISQILGMPEILGTEKGWPYLFALTFLLTVVTGLIIIPSIFMVVTLNSCPESPKYILINKGQEDAAENALKWLRGTSEVHNEMNEMRIEYEEAKLVSKVKLKEMCSNAMYRKPLIISVMVMLSQQLSGINAIIFYSTSIFMNAGLSKEAAVYATMGMGTINVLMTIVSMVLIEKAGRRTLHMIGLGGTMSVTLLLTISMALTNKASWLSYISVACVIGYIIFFATGPGSIPWFLVSELFGQDARPIATSIAVAVNWTANFVVGLTFLPITVVIGEYTFLIFVVLLAIFLVFTYKNVPETKGKKIEEITAYFAENDSTS